MNCQLVYALDYDRIWKVMSLNSDKSLGYTSQVYSFLPSPFYNDSLGFVVENHNAACRVLCYDMNHPIIDTSVNQQLVYLQLAEIQSYPAGAQPNNYSPASLVLHSEALAAAQHKWQQLIMPQWIQPYVLVAEQDWIATNILMQQLAIAEQHAAYQAYIAEQYALQATHASDLALHLLRVTTQTQVPSAFESKASFRSDTESSTNESRDSAFSPLTARSTSFDDDYSSTDASSIASPRIGTVIPKQANINKLTKEMRNQARLAQQRIAISDLASILLQQHERMHQLMIFLSNNDYIRSLTQAQAVEFLKQANLPLGDCILMLHKKHAKLSRKTLKALFIVFLEFTDADYQKHELPQGLINSAHNAFTNKYETHTAEDEATYNAIKQLVLKYATRITSEKAQEKPDASPEPIVNAFEISRQESKVISKTTTVKPIKPALLLKQIFTSYDADGFNTFVSNTSKNRLLYPQMVELLQNVINDSHNNTKAIEFLQKINLDCNICVHLASAFSVQNNDIAQIILDKIQRFEPLEYYFFTQEAMRSTRYRALMQNLKRNNRKQFDSLQQSFSDASAITVEHLTQLLKTNKSGTRDELMKYQGAFTLSNQENHTLLMVAIQNKTVAPELITHIINNSQAGILKRDNAQQTVLHYWAKFRPTNIELFEVLFKAYAKAREVELNNKQRSNHDMNAMVNYCKDAAGYSFMHLLLRNEGINVGVLINVIIILIMHTGNSLTQLNLIAKAPDGESPYTLLERRGAAFTDAIVHLAEEIESYLEYAADLDNPCDFLGTDFTDIFNLEQEPNNISKFIPKIAESKHYVRLRQIVEFRMELRQNIESQGRRKLKPILGEHDLKDSIYELYTSDGKKNQDKASLLLKLCIECESNTRLPNILFYVMRDIINKTIHSSTGLEIIRSIISLANEQELAAMLNYTNYREESVLNYSSELCLLEDNIATNQEIVNILANASINISSQPNRPKI